MAAKLPPPTPSPAMRAALLAIAIFHILLCSGEAYGWTALRPVLYKSGFFDMFDKYDQTTKMNLVSTLGISANAMCKLPLGFVLDRCGPRRTAVIGSLLFILGCLLMGWADKQNVAVISFAYFLLGTSGPFLQMPCFQFTNLFPAHKATLISLLITAFELSTGVFYIFNVVNKNLSIDHTQLFTAYACAGVFTLFTSLILWPDSPHVEPHSSDLTPEQIASYEELEKQAEQEKVEQPEVVGGRLPLIEQSFWRQVFSCEFFYVTFFFSVHNFTQGVVLTTMGMQDNLSGLEHEEAWVTIGWRNSKVQHYFPSEEMAEMMASLFSVILPMGFLPVLFCTMTGISGFILNRSQLAFFVVSLISCTYGGLFLFPTIPAYLVLFTMFPIARQFVFSTFISYSASTFGYKSFGVLNGLASTFAGFAQLLQNILVAMVVSDSYAFTWEQMDVLMSLLPASLLITPTIYFIRHVVLRCRGGSVEADDNAAHSGPGSTSSEPLLREEHHTGNIFGADISGGIPVMTRTLSVASLVGGGSFSSNSQPVPNFGSLNLSYGAMPLLGTSAASHNTDSHLFRSPATSPRNSHH